MCFNTNIIAYSKKKFFIRQWIRRLCLRGSVEILHPVQQQNWIDTQKSCQVLKVLDMQKSNNITTNENTVKRCI